MQAFAAFDDGIHRKAGLAMRLEDRLQCYKLQTINHSLHIVPKAALIITIKALVLLWSLCQNSSTGHCPNLELAPENKDLKKFKGER